MEIFSNSEAMFSIFSVALFGTSSDGSCCAQVPGQYLEIDLPTQE
jgi:hypothetical protein